jgi:hypothetical protein
LLGDYGRSRILRLGGSTTLAFSIVGYQAPELIGAKLTKEDDFNEPSMDPNIFLDKLSTKTDVYAYAMVALQVC